MFVLDALGAYPWVAYWVAVTLGALLIFAWFQIRITRTENKRVRQLKDLDDFSTLSTDSPLEDADKKALRTALNSVHTRFRAIRRILFPTITVLWAVVMAFPLLNHLPATILSSFLGIVAVVLGIAGRPFIENVIAGLVISFSQPLRIGDTLLVDGHWGTVEDIALTFSVIKIWDWRRYVIPNSQLLQKEFINYSLVDEYQWAYVEFWVAYDSDLETVRQLALDAALESPYFAHYEEPAFWLMEMDKDGMHCRIAAWTDTPSEGWNLTHSIRAELMQGFQKHGIACQNFRHQVLDQASPDAPPLPPPEGQAP